MTTQRSYYSRSALTNFTRDDVSAGRVIKINPALITITDGLVATHSPTELQVLIEKQVDNLLHHKVRTFHVDINFPDYSGYGPKRPDINTGIFSPAFLAELNAWVRAGGGSLNVHLLTDTPREQLRAFAGLDFGAICFQLDVLRHPRDVMAMVDLIWDAGACASPVIETVGSGQIAPRTPAEVLALLEPALPRIGMLTMQAAGTASRSTQTQGVFSQGPAAQYIASLRPAVSGTLQLQGGVTTHTIGDVVRLGAEFLVCGTEIFHHPAGRTPPQVIDDLLEEAARALTET
jgi:pentose-5-phosphate-3-epimerase